MRLDLIDHTMMVMIVRTPCLVTAAPTAQPQRCTVLTSCSQCGPMLYAHWIVRSRSFQGNGFCVAVVDVTKHLLLGRDTALMAHGLTMRRATASDADCVFIAGCVDAASNHAVREEWFLRARASSAKAATAKLGPRVRLGSPAREGAFDATASHRFHDPVSHTSLETGKRIIQTDATSWHHHSNAWIICNGRGVRQYGAYTVHPTKIARRHRTLTYPDGRAYEAFLSALLHYDDVDRGGRGRGMAYCMGLSAATQLDASEAQLQPFINAARSTPHFPFDECAQLNRAYVEAHGLAAVSFIAYDDDCHIRFFKKMGARVVQRVVLPDSGQRLVGMLMGEVCEEW